jgi:hypothetical protein
MITPAICPAIPLLPIIDTPHTTDTTKKPLADTAKPKATTSGLPKYTKNNTWNHLYLTTPAAVDEIMEAVQRISPPVYIEARPTGNNVIDISPYARPLDISFDMKPGEHALVIPGKEHLQVLVSTKQFGKQMIATLLDPENRQPVKDRGMPIQWIINDLDLQGGPASKPICPETETFLPPPILAGGGKSEGGYSKEELKEALGLEIYATEDVFQQARRNYLASVFNFGPGNPVSLSTKSELTSLLGIDSNSSEEVILNLLKSNMRNLK